MAILHAHSATFGLILSKQASSKGFKIAQNRKVMMHALIKGGGLDGQYGAVRCYDYSWKSNIPPKIWELSLCCFVTKNILQKVNTTWLQVQPGASSWVVLEWHYQRGSSVAISPPMPANDPQLQLICQRGQREKGLSMDYLRRVECCNSYPNANEITFAVILYYQLWCQLICQRGQREWIEGAQGSNS